MSNVIPFKPRPEKLPPIDYTRGGFQRGEYIVQQHGKDWIGYFQESVLIKAEDVDAVFIALSIHEASQELR